ncbi:MAG: hypothetical protein R6U95_09355 [Bacteroidales bacterium]
MAHKLTITCIFFYSFCIIGCTPNNSDSNTETQTAQDTLQSQEKKRIIPDSVHNAYKKNVVIEGMYATNTALPIEKNAIYNLFDNDTTTYWQTPDGSSVGEGLLFYFSEPINLCYITIKGTSYPDTNRLEIISCVIYQNGRKFNKFIYPKNEKHESTGKIMNLPQNEPQEKITKNVYIRINTCSQKQQKFLFKFDEKEYWTNKYGKEYSNFYPEKSYIQISEIRFLDKNKDTIQVLPPLYETCKVTASSVLEPSRSYSPEQLFDCNTGFAWAAEYPDSTENHTITCTFDSAQTITKFAIWNGYQRSQSHFQNNSRVARCTFASADTSFSCSVSDKNGKQYITLPEPLYGKQFTITLTDFYKGKRYKDVVISEIRFFNQSIPIIPKTDFITTKVKDAHSIKSKYIQKVMDRYVHTGGIDSWEENYSINQQHFIILRSDFTFVYYREHDISNDEDGDYNKGAFNINFDSRDHIIAEGGWEFLSENDTAAFVRIFGKMYTSNKVYKTYIKEDVKQVTNIFQDSLTITDSYIQGTSYIRKIHLLW